MKIKVCGMRNGENIREADRLPIDMIGLIFYPRSPRYVDKRPEELPEKALRAGVFVNEPIGSIREKIQAYRLDFVQLHGDETPGMCGIVRQNGVKVIKAFSIESAGKLKAVSAYEDVCDFFLFDTATPGYGGSGKPFDWGILKHYTGKVPFLLSGGIGENDAPKLAEFSHPQFYGIDLNSRFEISPGIKDIHKLTNFITELSKLNLL